MTQHDHRPRTGWRVVDVNQRLDQATERFDGFEIGDHHLALEDPDQRPGIIPGPEPRT